MNELDLRALVREAVARHMGGASLPPPAPGLPMFPPRSTDSTHPSHAVYLHVVNASDACVIEPGVACNHCNYCRSHGH